jgi:hypothetical protein
VALLSRAAPWIALACALCTRGCATTAPLGHVELWLQSCGGRAESCADAPPSAPGGEHFAVQAFIDPGASRYAPHGLYAYFELPREDGSLGLFELDVPTDAPSDIALEHFQASYRELSGKQLRFDSSTAEGHVTLPSSWSAAAEPSCGCEEGAFELRFVDAGTDRIRGTADDGIRRLSLGLSEGFCRPPASMAIPTGLHLDLDRCDVSASTQQRASVLAPVDTNAGAPSAPSGGPCAHGCYDESAVLYRNQGSGCGGDSSGGCGSYEDPNSSSSGGCGGDATVSSGSGSQAGSSSGCGGSSSSSSSSSHSGCEGDSSSSSSKSGCEGDTAPDDSSSCALAQRELHRRLRPHRSDPFAGTGLPLLLACLLQRLRVERLRARASARDRVG